MVDRCAAFVAVAAFLYACQSSPNPRTAESPKAAPSASHDTQPTPSSPAPLASADAAPRPAASPEQPEVPPQPVAAHTGKPVKGKPAARRNAAAPTESQATPSDRTLAPGSTRGTIACGTSRCRAGKEQCVSDPAWHCVPTDTDVQTEVRYACDDASDCAQGQACCQSFASALELYVCSARAGSHADCRQEVCVPGDGASCPKGQTCEAGICRPPAKPATCRDTRCPTAKPACLWAGGEDSCIALDQAPAPGSGSGVVLQCSRPDDCGPGMACCTNGIWDATHCLKQCDHANNGTVCVVDADCPKLPDGGRGRCLSPSNDEPGVRDMPAWLKFCRWE